MVRFFVLIALVSVALADERADFTATQKKLQEAYFDELAPDERDRLIEGLGVWDNPGAIKYFGQIAARYSVYLSNLEAQREQTVEYLSVFAGKTALTAEDSMRRSHFKNKLGKIEAALARASVSSDLLVKTLGSYKATKTVESALNQLARQPTWRVRQFLAGACAHWHTQLHSDRTSKRLFGTLNKLAGDQQPRVRIEVARAMPAFHRIEALDILGRCLSDGDFAVRYAAVKSLHKAGTSEAVDLLVNRMQNEQGRLKEDINDVLQDLSGQSFSFADQWMRWWKSVGRNLPAKATGGDTTHDPGKPKVRKPGHRFYGIPSRSDQICYIIDISGSMKKEVEEWKRVTITGKKEAETAVSGKTRLEVAKNELKRAVRNLNSRKQFSIIFFNQAARFWMPKPLKATPANKQMALKEIDALTPRGSTYTLGALRQAFKIAGAMRSARKARARDLGVDTIFLISDGGPTDDSLEEPRPMEPDPILEQVRQWNQDFGIKIHTIAVDTMEVGTYFLKQLALQNGGKFVERRNPTKKKK